MSDARTSPAPQARHAVPAVLDLRGVSKVHGSRPTEVHAPRQAAAPFARAIAGSCPRVSNVTAKAERDWIRQAPTCRNGPCLMALTTSSHERPPQLRCLPGRMWG
jgi:hypothetical protein